MLQVPPGGLEFFKIFRFFLIEIFLDFLILILILIFNF